METIEKLVSLFKANNFKVFENDVKLCYSCLQDVVERFTNYFDIYCQLTVIETMDSESELFIAKKRTISKALNEAMSKAVDSIKIINKICLAYKTPVWADINLSDKEAVHNFIMSFVMDRLKYAIGS